MSVADYNLLADYLEQEEREREEEAMSSVTDHYELFVWRVSFRNWNWELRRQGSPILVSSGLSEPSKRAALRAAKAKAKENSRPGLWLKRHFRVSYVVNK